MNALSMLKRASSVRLAPVSPHIQAPRCRLAPLRARKAASTDSGGAEPKQPGAAGKKTKAKKQEEAPEEQEEKPQELQELQEQPQESLGESFIDEVLGDKELEQHSGDSDFYDDEGEEEEEWEEPPFNPEKLGWKRRSAKGGMVTEYWEDPIEGIRTDYYHTRGKAKVFVPGKKGTQEGPVYVSILDNPRAVNVFLKDLFEDARGILDNGGF